MGKTESLSIASESKVEPYPIEVEHETLVESNSRDEKNKMIIRCKSCNRTFDSTFTADEFALLSKDQNESGTLHLCPHCGHLAIYLLKDYS